MNSNMDDLIAVVGIAGRFPGANSIDEFWRLLDQCETGIGPVPTSRWDADRHYVPAADEKRSVCFDEAGFISDLENFDWGFFGISEKEAERLDPQQKLALEVSWEALESACIDPRSLSNTDTAVIFGVSHSDHAAKLKNDHDSYDGNLGPHSYDCFVSNRISHFLNLRGPSYSINSSCASSLHAIHQACQSLKSFETDLAICGGSNTHLLVDESVSATMAGWLSKDNKCKSFSKDGDGFVRGEGCGVVILKRLADAKKMTISFLV